MFRTADHVKKLRNVSGAGLEDFAKLLGVAVSTVQLWEKEGMSDSTHVRNKNAVLEYEEALSRPNTQEMRARISGALVDLPSDDLAALLADVKRRQLAALRRELETSTLADPESVADDAQSYADSGSPSQQIAG